MTDTTTYWDKIPLWNPNNAEGSFEIIADQINGRIPVTRLDHWRNFSQLLEHPFFNHPNTQYIFRGHRRYDWRMTPSLARITDNDIIPEDLALRQLALFRKAIRGRISDHSLLSDGPEDDELWSIGQHYGLMTPLLDWTYSPYVALFFAFAKEDQIDEKENPYRALYILNYSFIADDEICPEIRVFEPKKDDYGRLVSQAGLFTFSPYDSTIEDKLTEVLTSEDFQDDKLRQATEEEQPAIIARYICKVFIKNEEQQGCLRHLRRMNVHHASLFPDIIGAAEYCNLFISEIEREKELLTARQQEAELAERVIEFDSVAVEATLTKSKLEVEKKFASISDLLKAPEESKSVDPARIQLITEKLSNALSKSMVIDWQERDALQAEMINITRVLLRKYDYPENAREYVIKHILETLKDEGRS